MGSKTGISWCDCTFNPIRGCEEISPACDHCYARELSKRNPAVLGVWGGIGVGTRVVAAEKYWSEPLKWNETAAKERVRKRVFCESLGDVFESWEGPIVDHTGKRLYQNACVAGGWSNADGLTVEAQINYPLTMHHVRARLFKLIDATPWLDWLLLTKRPENIIKMWAERSSGLSASWIGEKDSFDGRRALPFRSNVWLGTTVENQEQANIRIPELLKCRKLSPVLWLSCEPLLGPVDLQNIQVASDGYKRGPDQPSDNLLDALLGEVCSGETGCLIAEDQATVNWVVTGGESGHNARPSHPDWYRSLRDQCSSAGVPFHFKQNGEYLHVDDAIKLGLTTTYDGKFQPYDHSVGQPMLKVGTKKSGRLLDGVLHDAFPVVDSL